MIYTSTFWFVALFSWSILPLQSDWSLSCDYALDYGDGELLYEQERQHTLHYRYVTCTILHCMRHLPLG